MSPILRVADLNASILYYTKTLGFRLDWHEPCVMASVSRDGLGIMLRERCQGNPGTWLWIGVEDAAALYREYSQSGANVKLPPTNYPWAYEFHVQDPDRHVLRFGSEQKPDEPFAEWVEWYSAE